MARTPTRDPLELELERAFQPGRFIEYNACSSFVSGLDEIGERVAALVEQGEAGRAVHVYEMFLAGCFEKVEEVDDSGGNLGMFVERLLCDWIRAREAAGADCDATAAELLRWMDKDPYGFCYEIEKPATQAFSRRGLAAFERAVRARFDKTKATTRASSGANDTASEQRRWARVLRAIYAVQRNASAYVAICEEDELSPKDCEALAQIHTKRRNPAVALDWVERGLALQAQWGPGSGCGFQLEEMRRELLTKVGRGEEALKLAWQAFEDRPSEFTYDILMKYAPKPERQAWHAKAMEAAEGGELDSLIPLWLKTREIDHLVDRLRTVNEAKLEGMSHFATEPAAKKLVRSHPDVAAKLYRALGMRILAARKSHPLLRRGPFSLRTGKALLPASWSREQLARPGRIDTPAARTKIPLHAGVRTDRRRPTQKERTAVPGTRSPPLGATRGPMRSVRGSWQASKEKVAWGGVLTSVQARIRLTRSFDQSSHTYQGFVLRVQGTLDAEPREFVVAIGEAAQAKHRLRVGDCVSGLGVAVADPRLETAELYKVSKLKVGERATDSPLPAPPWQGVPPDLGTYRARGHRRLAARTYHDQCRSCIWGCRMAVEMILDPWNPTQRRYRTETFCYGPVSCPAYKAGPRRNVPGRKGMSWEEPDWVDEDATSHRGPDD